VRVTGEPGDFDRDGRADIVTGAGPGGGPHVRVFRLAFSSIGTILIEIAGFFPYDPAFTGGVRVASCDMTGDGVPEIVTAAGPGGGPHVRVFDGETGAQLPGPRGSFFAYAAAFTGGVVVACADVNGDGVPDIITGPGRGVAPTSGSSAAPTAPRSRGSSPTRRRSPAASSSPPEEAALARRLGGGRRWAAWALAVALGTGLAPAAAAGPDGNLWFTEQVGNRIGRITPAGVITEFSVGLTANSRPFGITAGPDGNLWFSEFAGNQIGRIPRPG
jgi:hypothetical protein